MKLFLLFIAIIFPADIRENFTSQINQGYEIYREVLNYENPYYEISIIQGINNDKVTFGLYFYNHKPTSDPHRLLIYSGGKEYRLETNSRKDIFAPAIKLNQDVTISIYDSFGRKRGNSIYIDAMEANDFRILYDDYRNGENIGINLSSLSRNLPALSLQGLLLFAFGGIIVFFGIIILFLFITKKGMFNPKKKAENVFNFREFAQTLNDRVTNDIHQDYEEVQKPIYERQRIYEDEEEVVDVTEMLKNKGYNVNYPSLTEAEKNEIMLELMMMRDLKDITLEQYQQEVVKLWSK